ncbi:MAG: hypothetical protein EPO08_06920 [Rhodospirillaceae bacterium]|nr:MAG: hypothetical protein EPO08_06920 [Rhodospirillaceae bacterium]
MTAGRITLGTMVRDAGRVLALGLVIIVLGGFDGSDTAGAADVAPALPFTAPAKHMGVSSCAGSTCHGSITPWPGSTVRQDEFVVWLNKDPHAQAYKTLLSERSKRIAKNLGLDNAYDAKICLDCHADNVAPDRQADGFQMADGVGCESCHGGAENWLGTHTSNKSNHAANIKLGLYPTDDAMARAKLCLSCHFGDTNRTITHRIMGAGHPRLSFELDTFTATEPPHFTVDANYRQRKSAPDHIKLWVTGQMMAVDALLGAMTDPNRNHDGIFPELVYFDCHACHHPMSEKRWEPRASAGIGPGVPRIADANMIMLGTFLDQFDPSVAVEFHARVKALHQASLKGPAATTAAAEALKSLTEGLAPRVADMKMTRPQMRSLLMAVIDKGTRGEYADYAAAEQATMALSAILDAMKSASALAPDQYKMLTGTLNKCYTAVEKDEAYDPRQFMAALQDVEAVIPKT